MSIWTSGAISKESTRFQDYKFEESYKSSKSFNRLLLFFYINPLVPTEIQNHAIKMNPLYFDKVNGPEQENRIQFDIGGQPFE